MRQPVLLDYWESGAPAKPEFTTVGNWQQSGRDFEYDGETYLWSKHHELVKFLDVPRHVRQPIEFATNLGPNTRFDPNSVDLAFGVSDSARCCSETAGAWPTRRASPPIRGRIANMCAGRVVSSPSRAT